MSNHELSVRALEDASEEKESAILRLAYLMGRYTDIELDLDEDGNIRLGQVLKMKNLVKDLLK